MLTVKGLGEKTGTFDSRSGGLHLTGPDEVLVASWSFDTLMTIWNRKHAKAVYVPSARDGDKGSFSYRYGSMVFLGEGTSFGKFLRAIQDRRIFYDPGIKVENVSTTPKTKRRSQFRVRSKDLKWLYDDWEKVSLDSDRPQPGQLALNL